MRQINELNDVALVILNYNSAVLTIKAVKHLLSFGTELQLIIVDNCSKDNSKENLEEEFKNNKNVHLLFNENNLGYANGNNIGITYVEKLNNIHFIGIMNPDVIVDIKTIVDLRNVLSRDESLGFVTTQTYFNGDFYIPNVCAWKLPDLYHFLLFFTNFGSIYHRFMDMVGVKLNLQAYYYPEYYKGRKISYVDVVQGCFFMGSLQTFLDVGKMDENTFLYYEENILGVKVRRIGKRNAVIASHYVQHNHKLKDMSLIKRSNKIFDMTCFYNSRDYFIREYYESHFIVKALLRAYLCIDFCLRKVLVNIIFKD